MEEKHKEGKLRQLAHRLLGIKLGYRMFFIYIIGGFLPLILIGVYLIHGTNRLLVEQAENEEIQELDTVATQISELEGTLTTVSKYFYFDSQLEEIAKKQYTDYQDMINDYKNYTNFLVYRQYYNKLISNISVYMENDTIKGNLNFVQVDDEIRSEDWYERVSEEKSGIVWAYLPHKIDGYDHTLALCRMIKTKKSENVGALVIYIRPERFEEYIRDRAGDTFLVLNGGQLISSKRDNLSFKKIKEEMPDKTEEKWQKQITIDGEEYIMTCETIQQKNSTDYLQVVGVRAYRDILKNANKQSRKSIILSGISVLFAVTMIMLFSWSFSRRVEHFREQMQKAASGSFALEKKLEGNDEISQLYDYLNTMIHDIQKLLSEVYREKLHAEQLKTSQKDAELKMLTSQINPHFLYNTLETIRMKARVNKQYEIEELVKMLGKILRSSIQAGEKEVEVKSEVELVEYYLKIQQYRFGDRISYSIAVEYGLENKRILPLILQPIVENSIIHGLEGKEENGLIAIAVRKESEIMVISVTDNGSGIEEEKLETIQKELKSRRFKGEHIGIGNVNQRVKLKYGDEYGVTIKSEVGVETVVEIRLPLN
jgi:two-component system sensor histidine kinase YesM